MQVMRPATAADYALYARLFPDLHVPDPVPSRDRYERDVVPFAFVCERDGQPVGLALVQPLDAVGYVRQLLVVRERRRQGVGRALLLEAARRFVVAGCGKWCLNVAPDNSSARALYTSLGLNRVHDSAAVRVEWSSTEALPVGGVAVRAARPMDVRPAEAALSLPAGLLERQCELEGRVVIVALDDGGDYRGAASFDPAFPGCAVFRAVSAEDMFALLLALRPAARPGDAELQLVLEDSPALVDALERIGGRRVLDFEHWRGALADVAAHL